MKGLKRLCTITLALAMAFMPLQVAKATDDTKAAESAKEGVVQVNTVFTDSDGTKHIVCGGTGFIIGETDGTEYVITCNHLISPDEETQIAAFEYFKVSNTDNVASTMSLSTEVVVEGDVVLTASIVNSSAELDIAVLQLPQPIYTRTPLTILSEENYDINNLPYGIADKVFALGFPDEIRYDSQNQYYSTEQIIMTTGSIVNLVNLNGMQVIESDVSVAENNCGGPLVNESGHVIGMSLLDKDGMYSCALDSTKITKILDGLGIKYTKISNEPEKEEAKNTEQQEDLADDIKTEANLNMSSKPLIIICILAVAIIAVIVAVVIIFVIKKDGTKPKKEMQRSDVSVSRMDDSSDSIKIIGAKKVMTSNFSFSQSGEEVSDETTILSAGSSKNDGETTLLSGELNVQRIMGTLIRKRTLENIPLNGQEFILGKDALHADYCIDNNSSISRKHAIISCREEGVCIQDCNSTNGTYVNGTRVESGQCILLNSGDIIKLANEEFEYHT